MTSNCLPRTTASRASPGRPNAAKSRGPRARPARRGDRVPVRHGRRDHPDRDGARRGLEGDVRRVPAVAGPRRTASRSSPSTRSTTTTSTSTASRASRARRPSSSPGASSCHQATRSRQAGRAHHLGPEQQEERAHPRGARARRGAGLRGLAALRQRRARRPASRRRSCRQAPTPRRCSRRAAWRTCSTSASTRHVAEERHLHGKPAPDTFLEAARMLGVAGGARRRLRGRARRGRRRAGRASSGSSWAWTGSARPTSCARTAPTWW